MKRNSQPEIKAAIDTRLEDVIAKANYRITLNNQVENARIKADKGLTYSVNGGIFKITPELISFVQTLLGMGQENVILNDANRNPIEITDLAKFQDDIVGKYYEVMNEFMVEYKSIRQKRNTADVLGV
jgi:hypothetical protein